jgi:hypothetical protein
MPGELITDPAAAFERVYCVNLDRRPDRWKRFAEAMPADWPFPHPTRVAAIDGKLVRHPAHWRAGGGAWGCFRSHLRLIEACINEGVRSVLLLEDDATFAGDFTPRVLDWLRKVPADWECLYLGGQHLKVKTHQPVELLPGVWQPFNVNRTHAWALQGSGLTAVYAHLVAAGWHPKHHIDHRLGVWHQQRKARIYCPGEWLVGQAADRSNISGRAFATDRFWRTPGVSQGVEAPDRTRDRTPGRTPNRTPDGLTPAVRQVLALIGTHSSGSSALAGALWHLRIWFGRQQDLTGFWGKGTPAAGGEHRQLARICEAAWPFKSTRPAKQPRWIRQQLAAFVRDRRREAPGMILGVKYPQLCLGGQQLRLICGQDLRVLVCDRPLEEAIPSIWRRTKAKGAAAEALAAHQQLLAAARDKFADQMGENALRVKYADLLDDPPGTLTTVAGWLGLQPTEAQLANAVASIQTTDN